MSSKTYGRTYRRRKLKQLEFAPLDKNNDNLVVLSKWMGERGYKPTIKMKPKIFKESGRGLMTKETIVPGDVIISIPQNLLITPKFILNSYIGNILERYHPKATGHEMLSIFLMWEYGKGKSSEWYPYISSLPREYSIPVYFCDHSLLKLPKPIYKSAKTQQDFVKISYSNLKPLLKELETVHPAFRNILNFELYKWAWSSVNTRCIFMECLDNCPGAHCSYHLALAPFLDLLNHNVDIQVQAGFNKETNHYEIISLNKFKKYSQVFISYGCHGNNKLFLEYGFLIHQNCNDYIAFSLEDILLAYKLCNFSNIGLDPKLKYMKENNLLKNATCSCDGISWNLRIIMKILISKHDIRLWSSFLHKAYNCSTDYPKFQIFKDTLVKLKIEEYKMKESHLNCFQCSTHQDLITNLCVHINCILKNALS